MGGFKPERWYRHHVAIKFHVKFSWFYTCPDGQRLGISGQSRMGSKFSWSPCVCTYTIWGRGWRSYQRSPSGPWSVMYTYSSNKCFSPLALIIQMHFFGQRLTEMRTFWYTARRNVLQVMRRKRVLLWIKRKGKIMHFLLIWHFVSDCFKDVAAQFTKHFISCKQILRFR